MADPRITLLTSTPDWYGSKSGYYEQLAKTLPTMANVEVLRPSRSKFHRALGKAYALAKGIPPRDQSLTYLEFQGNKRVKAMPSEIVHVTNLEAHLPMFSRWKQAPKNLIATIHFPPSCWGKQDLEQLKRCQSAILLYSQDVPFFERHIGKERVKVVLHGVDTDFFHPNPTEALQNRVLFCGQWLRDFAMLREVIEGIQDQRPEVVFDLIVPEHARKNSDLEMLQARKGVFWHSKLSDDQLRKKYWEASVAIFPLLDCGANNALVECLACGLPIVSTDVGGVRDYGGGTIFPLTPRGDAPKMVDTVLSLLHDPAGRQAMAAEERKYAEMHLSWRNVCQKHLEAYNCLAGIHANAS